MDIDRFIAVVKEDAENFSLSKLIVINPYPVPEFFRKILRNLRPAECVLLIDDGWHQSRIDSIEQEFRRRRVNTTILRVKAPNPSGLVHAKLYLFRWKDKKDGRISDQLYIGSPNASLQGFGIHSEALAEITFPFIKPDAVEKNTKYFDTLSSGKDVTESIEIEITEGARLWLPAIHIANPREPSFDSWLRAGRLCHRYLPDSAFGKLTVNLKKKLAQPAEEKAFARGGFVRETDKKILRRQYVKLGNRIIDNKNLPQWHSKYFTETEYGDWTSNDCFVAQEKMELLLNGRKVVFQANGANERSQILNVIKVATDSVHKQWMADFENSLNQTVEYMRIKKLNPEEYLHIRANKINFSRYVDTWRKKLRTDRQRAKLPEFYNRMQDGVAFPYMPPLGSDHKEFANDLCASLLRSIRPGNRNNLAKAVISVLGSENIAIMEYGEELYDALLNAWKDKGKRLKLQNYFIET